MVTLSLKQSASPDQGLVNVSNERNYVELLNLTSAGSSNSPEGVGVIKFVKESQTSFPRIEPRPS